MRIRQTTFSYLLNQSILGSFWVLGTYLLLKNDGVLAVGNSDLGVFERVLPFTMLGLLFLSGWLARLVLKGGVYVALDHVGAEITGIVSDRIVAWDAISSCVYKGDQQGCIAQLDLIMQCGNRSRVYTPYSSTRVSELRDFLDSVGVRHQPLTE